MKWIVPPAEELALLRADPVLWEQELDVRPAVARSLERALGFRAGRAHWRSAHDHLYALELADLGRGRPSMAMVYGLWDRFEPRPPEHEISLDLIDLAAWTAEVSDTLDVAHFHATLTAGGRTPPGWPADAVLRTPEERFADLPGFPYPPDYVAIEGLRMAYVAAGAGDPILCLHGEPTWSYLYRRMIPTLATAGRVIAPDLIGFGRSDKPVIDAAFSYRAHVRWLRKFVEALDLRRITLVCQDWGGLLGLRLVAQMPDRFARIVAMNTGLPDGTPPGAAFGQWRRFSQRQAFLDVPQLMRLTVQRADLSDAEFAAYGAPFPDARHQTAALAFPRLVPVRPDHPGAYDNRQAIAVLRQLELPVLLPWGQADPITRGGDAALRAIFRNVAPPLPIETAGHFIQEDSGEQVAAHIRDWIAAA